MEGNTQVSSAEIEPYRRVYGLETEFAFSGKNTEPQIGKIRVDRQKKEIYQVGEFLSNGSRVYLDVGGHIEYATPECLSIADLCASDIAGQDLMAGYVEKSLRGELIFLNTRVVADNGRTWGSHENYLCDRSIDPEDPDVNLALASFLATRPLLTGAGMVRFVNGEPQYHLAQKAEDIKEIVNGNTTQKKPLVNTRDEPLSDKETFRRLHITSGDSTMLPWATAMRFASTSLFLRLLEHGGLDKQNFELADPVATAHLVASDFTFKKAIERSDGKKITPIELQQALAQKALELCEQVEVPHEERLMAEEWYKATEELQQDILLLNNRVEWVTKLRFMMNFQQKRVNEANLYKLRGIDILWAELSLDGIARTLRTRGKFVDPFDAVDRAPHFTVNPPSGRAQIRSNAIKAIALGRKSHLIDRATVAWNSIKFGQDGSKALSNPYGGDQEFRQGVYEFVDKMIVSSTPRTSSNQQRRRNNRPNAPKYRVV